MTELTIEHNYPYKDVYMCRCDNCGTAWTNEQLKPIVDAEQRLTPGEETPAGACPECWALAFVVKDD